MLHGNHMLFVHALVILPDERILLKRRYYSNDNKSKWAATIEKVIFETDVPGHEISKAVSNSLKLNLTLFSNKIAHCIPNATIEPLNSITVPDYNRIIFPFIVRIKKIVTLQSETKYQFTAKHFSDLSDDIMCNTIYCHNLAEEQHTINTVHVMKEVHLKDVLTYVPRR